jgi:nucleoside-diphosphate-sugar epimerase
MKTVLILGANGRFGGAATQAFAAAGWRVWAQMRRAPAQPLPDGATALQLPLADSAALAAQATGASAVVHGINPAYTRWDAEAMPALRQGQAVAQRLGALFMLPGNVYNFGSDMPALLREDTTQQPDTPKAHLRCAMEATLQAAAGQGHRSVVIRAGDFYGCGTGSWLDQAIVKSLARGQLVYPGPLDRRHAWAYLPDLAAAFVAVAERPPVPAFETFHFDGHTLTGRQLLDALDTAADTLGLRPAAGFAVGGMPWGLIRAGGLVHPLWRELARMSYLWRVPHALDGRRLAAQVTLPPGTPLVSALTQSLIDLGLARASARPAQA